MVCSTYLTNNPLGIHGKPYVEWGGTGAQTATGWRGYCPHGVSTVDEIDVLCFDDKQEKLFLPWHRPLVLLFEVGSAGKGECDCSNRLCSRHSWTMQKESHMSILKDTDSHIQRQQRLFELHFGIGHLTPMSHKPPYLIL